MTRQLSKHLATTAALIAASLVVLAPTASAEPPTTTVDDFSFVATDFCSFPVTFDIHDVGTTTTHATSSGTTEIVRVVETDVLTANGNTVLGLPYTYTVRYVFDENGQLVSTFAQGNAWRFQLPDGSIFHSAGRLNFLNGEFVGTPNMHQFGPVCAALAA